MSLTPIAARRCLSCFRETRNLQKLAIPRQSKNLISRTETGSSSRAGVRRHFASPVGPGPSRWGGIKVGYLFGGLVGLGLLVTTYGLLEYYYSLQTWPEPVRSHLRAALKARNRDDFDRSEVYFQKAIDAALSLPSSSLSPDPLQKLSGLYITYAAFLESQGQLVNAFVAIRTALRYFGDTPLDPSSHAAEWAGTSYRLSQADHIRAIGLSQKIGHLALQLASLPSPPPYPASSGGMGRPWLEIAESHLSGALTAMLKLGLKDKSTPVDGIPSTSLIAGRDVDLPDGTSDEADEGGRVDKRGLGMTMEALSEVYARKKQYDLAGQLLLQAISILLPVGAKGPIPVSDRCQAALLMTSLSTYTLQPRTADAVRISKSWSLQALQIAAKAVEDNSGGGSASLVCQRAKSVGLQNLGMLAEIENDLPGAMAYFNKSLAASKESNFTEGRREATEAIRRVRNQGVPKGGGSM